MQLGSEWVLGYRFRFRRVQPVNPVFNLRRAEVEFKCGFSVGVKVSDTAAIAQGLALTAEVPGYNGETEGSSGSKTAARAGACGIRTDCRPVPLTPEVSARNILFVSESLATGCGCDQCMVAD